MDYKLGGYYIGGARGLYRNGGLYKINIKYYTNWDRPGFTSVREAYNFMRDILAIKYEDIKTYTHEYDFPNWRDFSGEYDSKFLCIWKIGDKTIWLWISRRDVSEYSYNNKYSFASHISITFETQEDRDRLKKEKEREKKEKEDEKNKSIKKAIDAL